MICNLNRHAPPAAQTEHKEEAYVSEKTRLRVERIMRKVRGYRRRREKRVTGVLCAMCAVFAFGIYRVIAGSYTGGIITASSGSSTAGYGAVLLHDGANAYIIVGLAAFAAGAALTALCIRFRGKK